MTKTLLTACLLALLTIGCGGRTRYPSYYTLAIAPPPDPAVSEARRLGNLAVRRFETAAYLRQGRIVYREAPNKVGFYEYHRWANDPGETIATAMTKAARSSGLFSRVERYHGDEKPEYLLSGRAGTPRRDRLRRRGAGGSRAIRSTSESADRRHRVERRCGGNVASRFSHRGFRRRRDESCGADEHRPANGGYGTATRGGIERKLEPISRLPPPLNQP